MISFSQNPFFKNKEVTHELVKNHFFFKNHFFCVLDKHK